MGVTTCVSVSEVATRPTRSVPPWQGLVGLLAGRGASGGARQGGGRLPDEAAQSAGSEPFAVRVLPEGWVWSPGGAGWSREFFARKMCAPLALYPSTQSEILETAQF